MKLHIPSFCILSFCILHSALCIGGSGFAAGAEAVTTNSLVTRHSSLVTGGSGPAASPYGACAHLPRDEFAQREGILSLMRVAGIDNVRCDLDWTAWEKDNAYPRFAEVLDAAEREGVTVLPILGCAPRRVLPITEHQDEFIAAFRPFVADVMRRFGARLPALEVWNEPNLPGLWNLPNPTNYLAVLKAAYDEIKAANTNLLVCLGGVSDVGLGYIRTLYELGAAPYFDVVCCHPYTIPFAPEGVLDAKLHKLRALMAEFGDTEKPIWITEVGFPTHKNGVGTVETQVLLSGLRIARPEQKAWRIACASIAPEGKTPPQDFAGELLAVLPTGSTAICCAPDELRALISKDDAVDAVIFPMDSEGYPADVVDSVTDFVRRGGVLVETGGAPMYFRYRADAGGNVSEDKSRDPAADRRAVRLGFTAWWLNPDIPTSTHVDATPRALAAGFKAHPAGYGGTRFVTPEFLTDGDEFIPLITGKSKSGKEIAAAAVLKFNSDFKGALVVSGLQKGYGPVAHSERQQALYLVRSILVALAEGVEKFYAYELRATEHDPYYSESHFGIVHRNLAPKPAYSAYATLTDRRPAGSARMPGHWRDEAQKLFFPQWTRPDGAAAGAVWTTGESRKLELEFDTDTVTFMDVFGLPIPLRRSRPNHFILDLSDAPIYFTGGAIPPSVGL